MLKKQDFSTLLITQKNEGISINQYCMYLLSRNDAMYNLKGKGAI